ncbi:hypothetical protein LSUE1_G009739 [Lachnellula suecica]|uniref:Uncharacterized protein n=1 Tax=Lachnellula suecica TaxID=602035 RepID=A0A8T9BSY1_9HELO|nr:hypothetical protein LSUE1_G009739 [Lachnellula suecica]
MSNPAPLVVTTTPPDSFTSTPLTPPPSEEKGSRVSTSQILDGVRNFQRGQALPPWHRFSLQEDEYTRLLAEVGKESESFQGFWKHKLKYDYFPSTSTFIFRMPTATHERFITSVVQETTRQLQTLATADSLTSEFARQLDSCGSTSIHFPDEYGRHDPDGSFGHTQAQYPGVIFEVSYSQKRRDLGRLADDYILGSDGNIRVVIGLDIEYLARGKGKEVSGKVATISVWRPRISDDGNGGELTAHQEIVDLEFRDKDGIANPSPGIGISLRLDDFATSALHPKPMSERVFIPATTLTIFLNNAEKAESMIKENMGAKVTLGKVVKKRRRQSTPIEELDETKEKTFKEEEERAEKRARKADKAWKP